MLGSEKGRKKKRKPATEVAEIAQPCSWFSRLGNSRNRLVILLNLLEYKIRGRNGLFISHTYCVKWWDHYSHFELIVEWWVSFSNNPSYTVLRCISDQRSKIKHSCSHPSTKNPTTSTSTCPVSGGRQGGGGWSMTCPRADSESAMTSSGAAAKGRNWNN